MNSFVSKIIFKLGAKLRNPNIDYYYSSLKGSEFLSRDELNNIQLDKLRKLLSYAYNNSAYYKQHFDDNCFDPAAVNCVEDLKKLPSIDKKILISENNSIHTKYDESKLRKAETSGTSGQSLSFMRSEKWDSANRASMLRCYDWYGIKPWQKNGYFWGYNLSKKKSTLISILDSLQNRKRLFNYSNSAVENFSANMKDAMFFSGYSSMIYQVAKTANNMGIVFKNVKMVKGTSEMILPAYQPEVIKAFGTKMISEYGAAETGLIAFECPEGNMHIISENVILEADENGEAIVTNLESHSFPVIRYRLGDIVKIDNVSSCACGRNHPILKEIIGRKGANVIGYESEYPGLTFYYVFKNISQQHEILINYKVVQSERGKVKVYLESENSSELKSLIDTEMEKYFSSDLEVEYIFTKSFPAEQKKSQYFKSEING